MHYDLANPDRPFFLLHNSGNNTYYCAFLWVPIENELENPLQSKLIRSLLGGSITRLKPFSAKGNCVRCINHLRGQYNHYRFGIHLSVFRGGQDIRIYGCQKPDETATLVFSDDSRKSIPVVDFDVLDTKPHSHSCYSTFAYQ